MGKIGREISKLGKVPHPKSRKTAQLAKKIIKLDHRNKTKQTHTIKTNLIAEKYLWFQNEFLNFDVCQPEIILAAVTKYLARFDIELEQIQLKHDIGKKRNRQHANREDVIKMTKSNEEEEFKTCGIELPDLLNPKQFEMLKSWNGELRYLQNFKLTRFSKTRLESLIEARKSRMQSSANLSNVDENTVSCLTPVSDVKDSEKVKEIKKTEVIMECE